jgi:hypothetical protein
MKEITLIPNMLSLRKRAKIKDFNEYQFLPKMRIGNSVKLLKYKIFTLFIFLQISSCGFHVIYDESNEFKYSNDLRAIAVQKNRTKLGQEIKNNLYDAFNPNHKETQKKYFLNIHILKSSSPTFITSTGASGRNKITITVEYKLRNIENAALISTGKASMSDNYDITKNRYATNVAEEYTTLNLAKTVSKDIRNLIVNDFIEVRRKCRDKDLKKSVIFNCPLSEEQKH